MNSNPKQNPDCLVAGQLEGVGKPIVDTEVTPIFRPASAEETRHD